MKLLLKTCSVLLVALSAPSAYSQPKVAIVYDRTIPQLQFGVQELENALKAARLQLSDSLEGSIVVTFTLNKALGAQAYQIAQHDRSIDVRGGDARGLMYAGLALADNVQAGKDLLKTGTIDGKPFILYRGIKFNIPLDARTPSYDDTGDAAQMNIETVWDFESLVSKTAVTLSYSAY